MPDRDDQQSPLMAALRQFESTEANVVKLERLWDKLSSLIPNGIVFGGDFEYEDHARSYSLIVTALPTIDGWKPGGEVPDLNGLAQNRFDSLELGEPSIQMETDSCIEEPRRQLQEYRFRLNTKRRALIRGALVGLIDQIDADVRSLSAVIGNDPDISRKLGTEAWSGMREHIRQIEVLLGSSVKKPDRWSDFMRHMRFGETGDLHDIETLDWPAVKVGLRNELYNANEPLPVDVDDLGSLVATHPVGPVRTALSWKTLDDEDFERLIFSLICDTPRYENPEWLMQTRAPDRGRDLSVTRVVQDELSGTFRFRVVIQCKHWLSRSVSLPEIAATKDQMATWGNPRVDILVIATSGRFTADAVTWVETFNATGMPPKIEMWPESHLEHILSGRPAMIAEFKLRS